MMKFARKLENLIETHGLSYRDVADRVGVSSTTVSRWLNEDDAAEPRMSVAAKLAELLDVPLDYLADDTLSAPPKEMSNDDKTILRVARQMTADEAIRRLTWVPRGVAGLTIESGPPAKSDRGEDRDSNPGNGDSSTPKRRAR